MSCYPSVALPLLFRYPSVMQVKLNIYNVNESPLVPIAAGPWVSGPGVTGSGWRWPCSPVIPPHQDSSKGPPKLPSILQRALTHVFPSVPLLLSGASVEASALGFPAHQASHPHPPKSPPILQRALTSEFPSVPLPFSGCSDGPSQTSNHPEVRTHSTRAMLTSALTWTKLTNA